MTPKILTSVSDQFRLTPSSQMASLACIYLAFKCIDRSVDARAVAAAAVVQMRKDENRLLDAPHVSSSDPVRSNSFARTS